jgi:hypothetical protein
MMKIGKKPLTLRWVFDIKKDDGRYKARLVARGFNQIKNVDFHEVYAVVAKPMSFKVFCAIAAALGWKLNHFDIKTAFLNADIKESIFIELLENQVAGGVEKIAEETAKIKASSSKDKANSSQQASSQQASSKPTSDKIGLLMKSVYGLKQASREWYMLLHDALLAIGFTKTHADHSVFTKWVDKNTIPIFIIVYIDDILTLSPSNKVIKAFEV